MSVSLLKKGMDRLYMNLIDVYLKFADDILLETLLTTQVENLYVVSHFKHETFTVLQYAQDFGTIVKESIKRTSRWAAKYYTHDRSHYPVPQSAVPLSAVATMAPLPSEGITPGMEEQMKEWLESYRPVRQRTVRSETTKDKAGALPPAVYAIQPTAIESEEGLRLDRIPYHIQLSVYNLWTMGMFLRCSRITERYKLMNMRRILMTKTLRMKSLSRECVLPDPAELFVHLCVSTCDSKYLRFTDNRQRSKILTYYRRSD